MRRPRISLQDLRRRIYAKAKAEPSWRFWGLFVHVCKLETLHEAYQVARAKDGAPGVDGVSFEAIESGGVDVFVKQIRDELVSREYVPQRNRRVEIPKDGGRKVRVLGIPSIRDRVVEVNEEKTRIVNLARGESVDFLGFRIVRARSRRGKWFALELPTVQKRTALLQGLRAVFRSHRSQPAGRVIREINPIIEGWVNYFAHGHASECFSYVRDWVEKKVRRHLARNSKRSGFGWKRWSRRWLYTHLGLFGDYRVHKPQPKALPV